MKTTMNYTKLSLEVLLRISCLEATGIWANMWEHPKMDKFGECCWLLWVAVSPSPSLTSAVPFQHPRTNNSADKKKVFHFY